MLKILTCASVKKILNAKYNKIIPIACVHTQRYDFFHSVFQMVEGSRLYSDSVCAHVCAWVDKTRTKTFMSGTNIS